MSDELWDARIAAWLDTLPAATSRLYGRAVRRFLAWAGGGDGLLLNVTPGRALDWTLAMQRAGLAPATIRAMLAALRSLYGALQANGAWAGENPFAPQVVRRPAMTPQRLPAATGRRLLEATRGGLQGVRDRAVLTCLMDAPTRRVATYLVRDVARLRPSAAAAVRAYLAAAGRAGAGEDEYVFTPLRARAAAHLHNGPLSPARHLSTARVAAVARVTARRAGMTLGARSLRALKGNDHDAD